MQDEFNGEVKEYGAASLQREWVWDRLVQVTYGWWW